MKFKISLLFTGLLTVSAGIHALELSSPDIQEGEHLSSSLFFNGFGCSGKNISPRLSWRDIPAETKSFAVTVYDPDAPTESGWWHWSVINIPAGVHTLKSGQSIAAVGGKEIRNDFGQTAFGGACPPPGHGMHRYQFTVWALPYKKMPVPDSASAALVGYMLNQDAIAQSRITATAMRKQK
ncbi:putative kinase inhibitor [Vibrio aerogenes CECT 7868]|uniref:Putative kinase inhibitor n=1 Tax=Vibrio aerogenes CECT 7868 TaxID=1216006 RepID=A0A1M5ZR46_9VIBR|nr:YbhB/YbcL family Raf kinase inhibitor-like protein [Vibrio aerogenes]SHI26566.1 putative kinase inhibitor [Vibrio aerogenes CECT 7868]